MGCSGCDRSKSVQQPALITPIQRTGTTSSVPSGPSIAEKLKGQIFGVRGGKRKKG